MAGYPLSLQFQYAFNFSYVNGCPIPYSISHYTVSVAIIIRKHLTNTPALPGSQYRKIGTIFFLFQLPSLNQLLPSDHKPHAGTFAYPAINISCDGSSSKHTQRDTLSVLVGAQNRRDTYVCRAKYWQP